LQAELKNIYGRQSVLLAFFVGCGYKRAPFLLQESGVLVAGRMALPELPLISYLYQGVENA
jgi:hypothetical protein